MNRTACEGTLKLRADVIRIQNRDFGNFLQTFGTICQDVARGTDMHAELTIERLYFPDRMRPLVIEKERAIGFPSDGGVGKKRLQKFLHCTGPEPDRHRHAGCKCLVQVDVKDVHSRNHPDV